MDYWESKQGNYHHLNKIESIRNMGVERRFIGNYKRSLGWFKNKSIVPNNLLYTIFQFTIDGEGVLESTGQSHFLPRGYGFMAHSQDSTVKYSVREKDWQFLYLELYGENAYNFVSELQKINGSAVFKFSMESEFIRQFYLHLKNVKNKPLLNLSEQSKLINLLRTEIISKVIKDDKISTLTERVISLIEQNPQRLYNIQELSKHFKVSREYLTREFGKEVKETPYAYILRRKMQQAFELLITKEFHVQEVASKLGFSSATVFGRQFKKHYGFSPRKIL